MAGDFSGVPVEGDNRVGGSGCPPEIAVSVGDDGELVPCCKVANGAQDPLVAPARAAAGGAPGSGRIFPREAERSLDDELRKIEQAVRSREEVEWKRNDPETQARADDMTRQLTDAIAKLEAEVATAEASGDARAVATAKEALEARRAWLRALGG